MTRCLGIDGYFNWKMREIRARERKDFAGKGVEESDRTDSTQSRNPGCSR